MPKLQEKTITPSTSVQVVKPDDGYDGLSKVTVNGITAAKRITLPDQALQMSAGTYSVSWNCTNIGGYKNFTSNNFVAGMFPSGGIATPNNGDRWSCQYLNQSYNPSTGIFTVNYTVGGGGSGWGIHFNINATIVY